MKHFAHKILFGCLWSALLLHGPAGPAQDPEAKKNKSMLMMMMQAERPGRAGMAMRRGDCAQV